MTRATYRHLILLAALLLALVASGISAAATRDNAVWEVGCEGFTSNGGGFVLDRDNTGTGREVFTITAMDGAGNIIFGPVSEDFFVGGSVYINDGVTFEWDAVPAANPLMVRVVSPAGNGFVEQVIYTAEGTCRGLPDGAIELAETDITSVANPEDVAGIQPGYLVVNTFRLNVRSGDGPEYTIVGQVAGGEELAVLGVNETRTWWYVQSGDVRGWVITTQVINRGDLTGTPVLEAQGVILPPRYFIYGRTDLYSSASRTSTVLCEIPGDREYVVVGRNSFFTWLVVEASCDGVAVEGWLPLNEDLGALRNLGDVPIEIR